MAQIQNGLFGALAALLTLGAVQFASGQDLRGLMVTEPASDAVAQSSNRAAKADRASAPVSTMRTQTIALRLDSAADLSVLIRVPAGSPPENAPVLPTPLIPMMTGPARTAVACEPVVSGLTEVAKLLQPGRCVT